MTLVLLRDLHFICIFMDAIKSELLTSTFQSLWGFELIQTITLLLQNERLSKLRFTPLDTTVYLSQLPNPAISHHLSSIRMPKCIRNEGSVIFFTRNWEKNNKMHFQNVEIGNDILIYINIKRVFQMELDYILC